MKVLLENILVEFHKQFMNLLLLPNYKYRANVLFKMRTCFLSGEIICLLYETPQLLFNFEIHVALYENILFWCML